jgi:hypothetical protein
MHTVGVTSNCDDATTLDAVDSSDFARKSQPKTVTGSNTVEANAGQATWLLETHSNNFCIVVQGGGGPDCSRSS